MPNSMLALALALVLVLAACAAPSDVAPAPLDPGAARVAGDGSEVLVRGALVVSAQEARLCSALAESHPPQCAGDSLVLEGLDPDLVVGLSRAAPDLADVRWSDFPVTVRGVVQGETLVAVEVVQDAAEAVGEELRLRFAAHPVPLRSGEPVAWVLDLTNLGDQPVTAEFNPAMPAEVVLMRDGEEAYRFTEGKVFTMSQTMEDLDPGVPLGFVLSDELSVPPGTYTARATFSGVPEAPTVEITVTVEG